MGGRKTAPPSGADVLYSSFVVGRRECDGLITIAATSGDHTEYGSLTQRAAVQLFLQLSVVLRDQPALLCLECARRSDHDGVAQH